MKDKHKHMKRDMDRQLAGVWWYGKGFTGEGRRGWGRRVMKPEGNAPRGVGHQTGPKGFVTQTCAIMPSTGNQQYNHIC